MSGLARLCSVLAWLLETSSRISLSPTRVGQSVCSRVWGKLLWGTCFWDKSLLRACRLRILWLPSISLNSLNFARRRPSAQA